MAELFDCRDVAAWIADTGVAPTAACGWAARLSPRGWEVSVGEHPDSASSAALSASGGPAIENWLFDLASLTKPMTAMAVVRSGLDRHARIGDLLPEVRGTWADSATIEALLSHRAGLRGHVALFEPLLSGRSTDALDARSALRAAADARREDVDSLARGGEFPPVYSDLGYLLAGAALARRASVQDAGEAIEQLVVAPLALEAELGTARTLSARAARFAERVVPTEDVPWRGGVVRGVVHDENAWALTGTGGSGHAGMFGSVRAVLAFGQAALDAIVHGEGPLAAPEVDFQWLVRERAGGTLRAGFDGKSAESSAGGRCSPRTFGHLGFTGTSLWIDPDAGIVTSLLTNRVYPTRESTGIRSARPIAHDSLYGFAWARRAP